MGTVRFGKDIASAKLLRRAGFRATFGRVALLDLLANAEGPMRVEMIAEALAGKIDQANTYRALEALVDKGLVRRVDLGHPHTHYELAKGRAHAHVPVAGLCRVCICV